MNDQTFFYKIVPLSKTKLPKIPGKNGGPLGKFVCNSATKKVDSKNTLQNQTATLSLSSS
jgi:hypothetical protein